MSARVQCGDEVVAVGARDRFGSSAGMRWVGAIVATVLVWGNCAVAGEPKVILLRGWFGVFSTGLDNLADELKAKGINAEVAGHLYWTKAVSEILEERAAGKAGPIVLVGHSQGANNVIDIARSLASKNVPVDLLVTLAPFLQYPVPSNVARAVNYYQSPGWGAPLKGDTGFHGTIANNDVAGDWTITHINIDKSSRVQSDILHEIDVLTQAKAAEEAAAARIPPAAAVRPRPSERKLAPN
jgi:alpha-beta hydrolase superfamily lysophospholipase